jgi:2-amino-4-hydroxy-6-hydroxymethyldihydropteridine diphosphokinase
MPRCLIGLGSNLGNRRESLEEALLKLRRAPQLKVVTVSTFYETVPVGGPSGQSPFLNAAAVLDVSLDPHKLLELLQQIEVEGGRRRGEVWGPRTLDLDLLLYENVILSAPTLELPHPRMAWRRFVLAPAAEVAGGMLHPVIGWTVSRLLEHLNTARPYVAIAGPIAAGKTHLARLLSERTSAGLISETLDENRLENFYADRPGKAWAMELEFLQRRSALLSVAAPFWSENRPLSVSDFWFDQSAAFARVWLSESQWPMFFQHWQQARRNVVQPKLLVLLDAPAEALMDRIRRRGRRGEQSLAPAQLERIRQALLDQVSQPGLGPVLKTSSTDMESALKEVLAAIQAMA